MKQFTAELLGTFWLVFGGCGCAILAASGQPNGIGALGISLAFGLSVMTAAYAFGQFSAANFNPAVSVGLAAAGRLPWGRVPSYVIAQVTGASLAAWLLSYVAAGHPGFSFDAGFAANGYGAHSPGAYSAGPAFAMEFVCTAFFLLVILGASARPSLAPVTPLLIGAALTLIHLVLIPITNASVNPARSTSQALFAGEWALSQLPFFWFAPIAGAIFGALLFRLLSRGAVTEKSVESPAARTVRPAVDVGFVADVVRISADLFRIFRKK